MSLEYIEVLDGIIVGHYSGTPPQGSKTEHSENGTIEVPDGFVGQVGNSIDMFGKDWEYLPLLTLVERGLLTIPEGFKIVDNRLIQMSTVERIKAGLEKPSWGLKVSGDELVQMSLEEQIKEGQVKVQPGYKYDEKTKTILAMTPSELAYAGLISQPILQSQLFAMIDTKMQEILANGFVFEGMTFAATQAMIVNANGIMSGMAAGIVSDDDFPMQWPDANDATVTFKAKTDFQGYVAALLGFVKSTSVAIGTIKNNIRQATSAAMAAKIYDAWEAAN